MLMVGWEGEASVYGSDPEMSVSMETTSYKLDCSKFSPRKKEMAKGNDYSKDGMARLQEEFREEVEIR